jgi:TP53 regulating kinase-like protein
MKVIYRGAEADVMLGNWTGIKAVYKLRKPLPYRLPVLDRTIRALRTAHEAQMMYEAKRAGVRAPYLYYVSPAEALIVMEYIRGERLKALLDTADDSLSMAESFGTAVGRLHLAGIMHGDLTTSNVIIGDGGLVVIDFGLSVFSQRVEDHAVDLRLIKETLTGAHSKISVRAFSAFLKGYGQVVGAPRVAVVRRKLTEIERRGRYTRVE